MMSFRLYHFCRRANTTTLLFFIHPRNTNIQWMKLRLLQRLPGTLRTTKRSVFGPCRTRAPYFSEEAGKTAPSFGVRHKLWRHPLCTSSIQFHQAMREMNDVWESPMWSTAVWSSGGGGSSGSVCRAFVVTRPAAICHGRIGIQACAQPRAAPPSISLCSWWNTFHLN